MEIDFDPNKNARNIAERGLSFEQVVEFEFVSAKIWQDSRKPYPEMRFLALGYLGKRLHVLCFTPISVGIRVISFRKANKKEGEKHELALTRD